MPSRTLTIATLTASLFCTQVAIAQSYSYSPSPLYSTREGAGVSIEFGKQPESRYQVIDGHLLGRPTRLTAISFRQGFHNYQSGFGQGRTWSNVTVDLSAGRLASVSPTFSQNVVGARPACSRGP